MPTWTRRLPTRTQPPPADDGASLSQQRPHAVVPASPSSATRILTPSPVALRPVRTIEESRKEISKREDLPAFESVYRATSSSKGGQMREGARTSMVALLHADSSATVLIEPDHRHLEDAFLGMIKGDGFRVANVYSSTSDFIFSIYSAAQTGDEKRQKFSNAASPAESQKVLNSIIQRAMDMQASDIHIHVLTDAKPAHSKVYFRIHGQFILQEDLLTDAQSAHSVCRAAYTGDSADSKSRSDTSFKTATGMYATLQIPELKNVRLRMQTMPHVLGYGMNLRILSFDGLLDRYTDLVSMGFSPEHQSEIISAFGTERGGLVLFIAGTGEGKTTTMMTAIPMEPKFSSRNWITIEDPVEIINPLLFQSPVKRSTGDGQDDGEHRAAITNSLRFDPDGISAGEIRDEITAGMAEKAAMTGHITGASLHGNDVFSAIPRLLDLGMRKINLLDGVARLFCHQKLVQTICPHCSTLAKDSSNPKVKSFIQEMVSTYDVDASKVRVRGDGCEHCYPKGTPLAGVKGRTVVAETVRFNRGIVKALRENEGTYEARIAWRTQRVSEYHEEGTIGKTLAEHALFKLLRGEIDPDTYLGVADSFDTHEPIPLHRKPLKVVA